MFITVPGQKYEDKWLEYAIKEVMGRKHTKDIDYFWYGHQTGLLDAIRISFGSSGAGYFICRCEERFDALALEKLWAAITGTTN